MTSGWVAQQMFERIATHQIYSRASTAARSHRHLASDVFNALLSPRFSRLLLKRAAFGPVCEHLIAFAYSCRFGAYSCRSGAS
jgi:hypothetical protein